MNSHTIPSESPEYIAPDNANILRSMIAIFRDCTPKEKQYLFDNVYTFECYFSTKPEVALNSFRFPDTEHPSEVHLLWNEHIEAVLAFWKTKKFPDQKDDFLEAFYEAMLKMTGRKPSESIKYGRGMRRVVEKYVIKSS